MKEDIIIVTLLFSLVLFPLTACHHRSSSFLLYTTLFLLLSIVFLKNNIETYDKKDFFPWNEVNIVKKRNREDTVIDCAWRLDQKENDDIFHIDDPVISRYSNSS